MNTQFNTLIALMTFFIMGLCGCTSGKRPFVIVQVCLSKPQDLSAFTDEMRSIAQKEGLTLIDDGANTQSDLERIGNPNITRAMHDPLVNMGMDRSDGVGLMIGNLGLPHDQLAIGFSEGSNSIDAHRFADEVISRLKQHWKVQAVPPDRGAVGMDSCESSIR